MDQTQAKELLANFETWPPEVQDSFLEIYGEALRVESELRTMANFTTVVNLLEDMRKNMEAQRGIIDTVMQELAQSGSVSTLLKELAQEGEIVKTINEIIDMNRRYTKLVKILVGKKLPDIG